MAIFMTIVLLCGFFIGWFMLDVFRFHQRPADQFRYALLVFLFLMGMTLNAAAIMYFAYLQT